MRPRSDWWDVGYYGSLSQGSVHDLSDSEGPGETASIIWIPDPEQRKGWREHYIFQEKTKDKQHALGFRPKGND